MGRRELLHILESAKEETTVLFSTHILSDVEHICDEIAFLHEGRIVLQGSLEEVRKRKKEAAMEIETERAQDAKALRSVFPFLKGIGRNSLLLEDTKGMPDLLRFIADKNMAILRIERQEAALEDLFMEVVLNESVS